MKTFIGTKLVKMREMSRAEYNAYRGWNLPSDEDGADAGYLVEYMDGGKPNMSGHAGYVSWSPKSQADAAYREIDAMNFGLAIEAMRKGKKVSRAGWDGVGMLAYIDPAKTGPERSHFGDTVPYFALTKLDGAVSKWEPSVSDALAENWRIV